METPIKATGHLQVCRRSSMCSCHCRPAAPLHANVLVRKLHAHDLHREAVCVTGVNLVTCCLWSVYMKARL